MKTRGPSRDKTTRTREAIVRAATEEFLEKGFASSTMAGIARRARLAKGTPYLYFQTKEALFAGVVRELVSNPLDKEKHRRIAPGEGLADYFRRTLLPIIRQIGSTGRESFARVVVSEGVAFPMLGEAYRQGVYEPLLEHIRTHARLALKRGELKNDALVRYPHLLLSPLWGGIIHNTVIDQEHPVDIGKLLDAQLELLCVGSTVTRFARLRQSSSSKATLKPSLGKPS